MPIPSPKDILVQGASIPAQLEASLPVLPKMSQMMTSLAVSLPSMPNPGQMGASALGKFGMNMSNLPQMPAIPVIKGMDEMLPSGFPKVSDVVGAAGYRGISVGGSSTPSISSVVQAGYRSISG